MPDPEALAREHWWIVRSEAKKFLREQARGWDLEEAMGHAALGLARACVSWDPDRGVPFGAYARIAMRRAMVDALRSLLGRRLYTSPLARKNYAMRTAIENALRPSPQASMWNPTTEDFIPPVVWDPPYEDHPFESEELLEAAHALADLGVGPIREKTMRVLVLRAYGFTFPEIGEILGAREIVVGGLFQRARMRALGRGRQHGL